MSIADKIAKIIAKADSTTSEDEAATFMAKAHAMMEQHGLSLLDVGKLNSDDPLGCQREAIQTSASQPWAKKIAGGLARYYGARVVLTKRGNHIFYSVLGRESARITFLLMLPFVIRQVRQLANAAVKDGTYPNGSRARTYIGNALAIRIWEMLPEEPTEAKDRGINALVPVDAIQALMEAEFPNLGKGRRTSVRYDNAAAGLASKVSINRQTGGATVKRLT